ncbi:MAG: hypothetical protein K0R28_3034 [Paenibacillus sp.]|jgi:hypothetical protein|nr:hypothetical protein [Paenibacillus sp.]
MNDNGLNPNLDRRQVLSSFGKISAGSLPEL